MVDKYVLFIIDLHVGLHCHICYCKSKSIKSNSLKKYNYVESVKWEWGKKHLGWVRQNVKIMWARVVQCSARLRITRLQVWLPTALSPTCLCPWVIDMLRQPKQYKVVVRNFSPLSTIQRYALDICRQLTYSSSNRIKCTMLWSILEKKYYIKIIVFCFVLFCFLFLFVCFFLFNDIIMTYTSIMIKPLPVMWVCPIYIYAFKLHNKMKVKNVLNMPLTELQGKIYFNNISQNNAWKYLENNKKMGNKLFL